MSLLLRTILLLLLFSLGSLCVHGQVAGFTSDVSSGCSPLAVHFTNTTGCASCTYTWDLDNGTGPIHLVDCAGTYTIPGVYTVTLTATSGGTTSTHTETITVIPSPTVAFAASDTAICPGTTIAFSSTTSGGTPGSITYVWNYGDGSLGSGTAPTHTYATPGHYNVTLSATNSAGCTSLLTLTSYIHVFTPAAPSFTPVSAYFCTAPGHAVFTNTTTGTGPFAFTWRFGDGATSTLTSPTHNYAAGSYNVTLRVTDGNGCTDSLFVPAAVFVSSLTPGFTFPATICRYSGVTFTNTSSTHISSSWDFGDGATGTTDAGLHTYDALGSYVVQLVVFDGHCYDTVSHTITVIPGPVTSFTQSPAHPCPPPVPVTFIGTAPSGASVTWSYGDGISGPGTTVTHTYMHRGIDTIKMITLDPATGCRDTIKRIDTLYDMVFGAGVDTPSGCIPLSATFGASAVTYEPDTATLVPPPYPWGIASYSWAFGDGATSTSAAPTHVYTAVGLYVATVTAVTGNGCIVHDSVDMKAGTPGAHVTFHALETHSCYNRGLINFAVTSVSGGIVTEFQWNYCDGEIDMITGGAAYHQFGAPGVFSVILTPYFNGCPGTPDTMANYITIDPPKSVPHFTVSCSPLYSVQFDDYSIGADTHLWMFGDGTTSTVSNPLHPYAVPGPYTIALTTYNITSGCRDTATASFDITTPVLDFSASDTAICRDDFILFTSSVIGGTAFSYEWYQLGIDTPVCDTSYHFVDTFHTTGIYDFRLVIEDQNGCLDTVTKYHYMHVAKPVTTFTVSPAIICGSAPVTFTDHSTDIPGTFLNYSWMYGDGDSATVATPASMHIFTITGTDSVTEIATDNIGCKDTFGKRINIYRPLATFTDSTHLCVNDSSHFINTSVGIASSFWSFGDGVTSTLYSPWHEYGAWGTYVAALVVTDPHGCKDSAISNISLVKPAASFYMDDSISICPPLTVHFSNTSSGAATYSWTFGDGSISVTPSPTNLYVADGYDTVMLVAISAYGCKDTAISHVNVFGYAGAFTYTPDSGCSPVAVHFSAVLSHVPNIVWDFADGNISPSSTLDTITHIYLQAGAYLPKLILSDNTGCENSSLGLDTIKIDGIVPGFTTVPAPVCVGTAFNLSDTSTSYWSSITSWTWTFNGSTNTISSPSYSIATPGVYPATLVVTDGWGCTANVTENVNVYTPPVITVSPDTTICVGDSAILTGYGGVSYTWADASTIGCSSCNPAHAHPTAVTQYTVTGTDEHGCASTDTTTVFIKTLTVGVARGDTQICYGNATPLYDSGGTKYTWLPAAGLTDPNAPNPLATPDTTTIYMAIAQLAGCIPDTNYVTVIVHPLPRVDAGPNQTLVAGSQAKLAATGKLIHTYVWDNAGSLSCDSCADPVASMSVTTTYIVQVASFFGCLSEDSVTVHIFCDNSQIFIPNSFTPNGDGMNDVFYPRGTGVSLIKSFRIYNRWGEMIFERSNIQINDESSAWDGTLNGNAPRPDVYVYVLDAICETGEPLFLKGDVAIIR